MRFRIASCLLVLTVSAVPAQSQLNQQLDNLFDDFLREGFVRSPGEHGEHFIPSANLASDELTPALNNLISGNVASFPLTSTVAGVTFDPVTGQTLTSSLGPIFTEPVETVGAGNISIGLSATYLSLNQFRGLPTDQMRFTFLHQDVAEPGLGDSSNESDVVDLFLDLDVDASIVAVFATFGLSRNLDLSVAVPFVNVGMKGNARARVNSATILLGGNANHSFGGDSLNPVLQRVIPYDVSAGGVGDLAVRLKYRFTDEKSANGVAALLDVRLPTGDSDDFLGTGNFTARTLLIGSARMGEFTPHVNLGFDYRNSDFDSDEFEVAIGFDQVIFTNWVFALEFLGEFDLDSAETIEIFPGTETIHGRIENIVDLSNIPERRNDHRMDTSIGFRYAPVLKQSVQIQILANLIVPLQDGGLRSGVAPTFGFSLSF